jgi:RNA polymerase sigma factor (sigma-70 family)
MAQGDLSDEALLAGMAVGEQRAAVTFVRRYQKRIFGLAYSMTGDAGVAEDVAQEAMMRVWRHAPVFDPRRGSVASWVLTITRNLAIDALRLRRAVPTDPDDFAASSAGSAEYNPEDSVRRGDIRHVVHAALGVRRGLREDRTRDQRVRGDTPRHREDTHPDGPHPVACRRRACRGGERRAMSEDAPQKDPGCARYTDDLAELALGVLTGRDRARALAHVDECPRCAEELEQMSRVADTVLQVAPEVEPPLGFESRLFERMGVTDASRPAQRRLRALPPLRSIRPRHWVPAAVAAAAAFAALGLGLSTASAPPGIQANATQGSKTVLSGTFVEGGETVGHVVAVGGSRPWMSMMLEDSTAQGVVHCVVVTRDGVTHEVGSFVAREGYGAWVAPLQLDPKDVRTAELVTSEGTVIASATLS